MRAAILSRLEAALAEGRRGEIIGGGAWLDGNEFDVEIATANAEGTFVTIEETISGLDGVELVSVVEIE